MSVDDLLDPLSREKRQNCFAESCTVERNSCADVSFDLYCVLTSYALEVRSPAVFLDQEIREFTRLLSESFDFGFGNREDVPTVSRVRSEF